MKKSVFQTLAWSLILGIVSGGIFFLLYGPMELIPNKDIASSQLGNIGLDTALVAFVSSLGAFCMGMLVVLSKNRRRQLQMSQKTN